MFNTLMKSSYCIADISKGEFHMLIVPTRPMQLAFFSYYHTDERESGGTGFIAAAQIQKSLDTCNYMGIIVSLLI